MPVRKFHSVGEMNQDVWRVPGDPMLYRAIAAVWAFGRRTIPRRFPPGVHRHRGIDALDAQTEAWASANLERLRGTRSSRQDRGQ